MIVEKSPYPHTLFLEYALDPAKIGRRSDFSSKGLYKRAEKVLHGYSSQTKLAPIAFTVGINELLLDKDENWYIDYTSGTYCSALGHGNNYIAEKVYKQLFQLSNCHSWLTELKVEVCERLKETFPSSSELSQFEFYCDGTTAVEAALRLVHLYRSGGTIVAFTGAFHGKSSGAALLTERPVKGSLGIETDPERCNPTFDRLPYPAKGKGWTPEEFGKLLIRVQRPISGIFVEPIQGVSGCVEPEDWFLPMLARVCRLEGCLLVMDEIFTGGRRTGEMWAYSKYDEVDPDIVLFGKILGGGLPLSGLAMKPGVPELLEGSSTTTTYGGNPVSLAACSASLDILQHPETIHNIEEIGQIMKTTLSLLDCEIRGRGCMFGFDLSCDGEQVFKRLIDRGVLTQIEGSTVRLCPPLTSRPEVIERGAKIIVETIKEVTYLEGEKPRGCE